MSTETGLALDELQTFVLQLYRLFKVGSMHLPNNEAVSRCCDQTLQKLRSIDNLGSNRLSMLFLSDTVFVNGRLLKADRATYESAVDLARYLNKLGYNELVLGLNAQIDDIRAISAAFHSGWVPGSNTDRVRLRRIDPDVLATLMDSEHDPSARMGRAYAQAVVVMRYVYDALRERRIVAPRNLKRLMQQFVVLANDDLASFTALARLRNPHDDDAGHAVKSAIVAMAVTRAFTDDLRVLARVGLATLVFDIGRPRAAMVGRTDLTGPLRVIPLLNDAQQARLPASTAVIMTAMSRLHPDAVHRALTVWEAQLRDLAQIRPPADGQAFDAGLEACIISLSWQFTRAMAFNVRSQAALTPDQAWAWLAHNAQNANEKLFCDLLGRCLMLGPYNPIPRDTPVQAPQNAPTFDASAVEFTTARHRTAPATEASGSGRARYAAPAPPPPDHSGTARRSAAPGQDPGAPTTGSGRIRFPVGPDPSGLSLPNTGAQRIVGHEPSPASTRVGGQMRPLGSEPSPAAARVTGQMRPLGSEPSPAAARVTGQMRPLGSEPSPAAARVASPSTASDATAYVDPSVRRALDSYGTAGPNTPAQTRVPTGPVRVAPTGPHRPIDATVTMPSTAGVRVGRQTQPSPAIGTTGAPPARPVDAHATSVMTGVDAIRMLSQFLKPGIGPVAPPAAPPSAATPQPAPVAPNQSAPTVDPFADLAEELAQEASDTNQHTPQGGTKPR